MKESGCSRGLTTSPAPPAPPARPAGLLGDTPARDYSRKLRLFNEFAERELRAAIATLSPGPGMRILDAGCGSGGALPWLAQAVCGEPCARGRGLVVGLELACAHAAEARAATRGQVAVVQADLTRPPLRQAVFDLVWSVNTINHLRDPLAGTRALISLVRPGGRIALGQSALLPEMYFAWDAQLERRVHAAVHRYYCKRYGLEERELAKVRSLLRLLLDTDLRNVAVRTFVIERTQPLSPADEAYLLECIFLGTWGGGERLRPYLSTEEHAELARLCDPQDEAFALRRPDFHFLQTFTLAVGELER